MSARVFFEHGVDDGTAAVFAGLFPYASADAPAPPDPYCASGKVRTRRSRTSSSWTTGGSRWWAGAAIPRTTCRSLRQPPAGRASRSAAACWWCCHPTRTTARTSRDPSFTHSTLDRLVTRQTPGPQRRRRHNSGPEFLLLRRQTTTSLSGGSDTGQPSHRDTGAIGQQRIRGQHLGWIRAVRTIG
jgi:hypothetical protein